MKTHCRKLSMLCVILIFSTVGTASILGELLIRGVRADSVNVFVQKDRPQAFILNPSNGNVYVVNLRDNTLSIVSGQTKTVIGNHTLVSKYPTILTFPSRAARSTYVVNLRDNTLSIVSGQTKTVIGNATFVTNAAGKTTFGLSPSISYNIATSHKVVLSSATSTKASSLVVKTPSVSTSPTRAINNNSSKAVATLSHPPLIP
jgi:YVTN family beta-propeller protein